MKKRKAAWYAAAVYHASQEASNDADAQAYFDAAGVTNPTYTAAINTFVIDLKAASLWTKFDRLWILANEDATAALTCVKSLEAATPVNTPTFTAGQGYTFNGTSNYLDSGFIPASSAVVYTQNSAHLSVFSRTNPAVGAGQSEIGIDNPGLSTLMTRWSNGNFLASINTDHTVGSYMQSGNASSVGLFVGSRTAAGAQESYKDDTSQATGTQAAYDITLMVQPFFIGATSTLGSGARFSEKQLAMATIGAGFSDAEVVAFDTCVDTLKTAIGF
jgi:hypothetical protein